MAARRPSTDTALADLLDWIDFALAGTTHMDEPAIKNARAALASPDPLVEAVEGEQELLMRSAPPARRGGRAEGDRIER